MWAYKKSKKMKFKSNFLRVYDDVYGNIEMTNFPLKILKQSALNTNPLNSKSSGM